jgi:hypothetical protein
MSTEIDQVVADLKGIRTQLYQILGQGAHLMAEMDDLVASVGKLVTDIDTTIAEAQLAGSNQKKALDAADALVASLQAGDVITAKQIADLEAQLAALKATAVQQTSAINAVDVAVTAAGANLGVTLPPALPNVVPTSGPVGTVLTITGAGGFGASQGTTTLTLNGTDMTPGIQSWNDTSIVVAVPVGATSGNIVITVNGIGFTGVIATLPFAVQ